MTSLWFVIIGALLVLMSLIGFAVERWPLSPGLIYLLIGIVLGPAGFSILHVDPVRDSALLLRAFEITLLISLFSVGLKLRARFSDRLWRMPLMLATLSMLITIGALTYAGHAFLGFPLAVALLFGAIMAPTDPVLASEVQIKDASDRDRVRFGLTAEGGLNDGAAFPFVMLGLGLLGLHDVGEHFTRWITIDVVWGVAGALLIGALCGLCVGKLLLWLRTRSGDPVGLEEFLALGLIGLSYGLASMLHTLGFLAVLAAGVAMRRLESHNAAPAEPSTGQSVRAPAVSPEIQADSSLAVAPGEVVVPGHMVASVLTFNERLERIAEVGAVLLLGGLMSSGYFSWAGLAAAAGLLLIIRPLSVFVGALGSRTSFKQKCMVSWFGVRGVGSLYYLMYAIEAGLRPAMAKDLLPIILTMVATSIVVHGVSASPLMSFYSMRRRG